MVVIQEEEEPKIISFIMPCKGRVEKGHGRKNGVDEKEPILRIG